MSMSVLDHPLLNQRYFFPRQAPFDNPFRVDCGNAELSCYYNPKFPKAPTVIYFHGNGEVVADYLDFFVPIFEQMGFNLFLAEYRGYGMSTGEPTLAAMLDDVDCIINTIGLPPGKLVLYGRSIGSLYAVHGAARYPGIAGLILESGVAVLLERLLMRVRPEELETSLEDLEAAVNLDFDQQAKLAAFRGATLVMHAKNDTMVNCVHGETLHQWAPKPKYLKIFEKGDHNDIMSVNAEEYFQLVHQFISGF